MSKIDWSKAPEWADKCGYAGCEARQVWLNDDQYTYAKGQQAGQAFSFYHGHGYQMSEINCISRRPDQWNGSGLPPADTMVEIRNVSAQTEWAAAKIVFASRNVIVWDWAGEPAINGLCTSYTHAVEIRPIRSPEQIAKDERSKACDEMFGVILKMTSGDPNNRSDILEALYDAGYRKQKD